jgi:hypothetical protein
MNIQEIEEMEFSIGRATEAQNCVTEAEGVLWEHNSQERAKIDEAIKAGKFVVVASFPWLCKATDAIVGQGVMFHKAWDSREEANYHVNHKHSYGEDDDMWYSVEPALPQVAQVETEDDVPF